MGKSTDFRTQLDANQPQANRREFIAAGQFVDYRGSVGDTLTLADGRIQNIGFAIALDPALPVVDLGGRTVIPGFIDAHVHYTRAGINPGYQERRIERAFSITELQETIAA